jgi:hypothetical protein
MESGSAGGDLYMTIMSGLAELLSSPTGFRAIAADMYDIDIRMFEQLVAAVLDVYVSSTHDIFRGMIKGVLLPSVVVLERAGRSIVPKSAAEADILVEASGLSMAR